MTTTTVTFQFPAPGVSALSIVSLTRTDTGATVSGTIAGSGTTWTLSISDPTTGLTYAYTLLGMFSTGAGTFSGLITGTPGGIGYYTNQTAVQLKWGANNIAVWSNLDSSTPKINGQYVPNVVKIQDALNETDAAINYVASLYNRQIPIPVTIQAFTWLSELAAYDCGIRLYQVRGASGDGGGIPNMAGVMKAKRAELWGDGKPYKSGGMMGKIPAFFKNWQALLDAPRVVPQTNCIAVVVNPVVAPYGSQSGVGVPADYIPLVPNADT